MAKGGKSGLIGTLFLMTILDTVVIGLAAYTLDKTLDGVAVGNSASGFLAILALVAGIATVAAVASGLLHLKHYNSGSLSGASSTSLIAWGLTLLAVGLACKQIDLGNEVSEGAKMKTLASFVIILAFFNTIYVLLIHGGLLHSDYGVGYV